jgi:hypothetical protein
MLVLVTKKEAQAADGTVRAVLALTKERGEPFLVLLGQGGTVRASVNVDNDNPQVNLCDEKGRTRVSVGTGATGSALTLYDAKRRPRAMVALAEDIATLTLWDEAGDVSWSQGLSES